MRLGFVIMLAATRSESETSLSLAIAPRVSPCFTVYPTEKMATKRVSAVATAATRTRLSTGMKAQLLQPLNRSALTRLALQTGFSRGNSKLAAGGVDVAAPGVSAGHIDPQT